MRKIEKKENYKMQKEKGLYNRVVKVFLKEGTRADRGPKAITIRHSRDLMTAKQTS